MSSSRTGLFKPDVPESAVNSTSVQGEIIKFEWGNSIEPSEKKVSDYLNKPTVNRSDLLVFPVVKF